MKKQPEITRKTRQCFINAFWTLIKEKPISKIAVNELTRRTTYNRGTFYEYFMDIDDLVANAETDLLEELKHTILEILPESDSKENSAQIVSEENSARDSPQIVSKENSAQNSAQIASAGPNPLGNLFQAVFMAMNERIYLLLGPNGDSAFFPKVKSELLPLVEDYLPIPADSPYFDYLINYVNSAMFNMLQLWNERGKDLSTEEISMLMQNLVLHGLSGVLQEPELCPAIG